MKIFANTQTIPIDELRRNFGAVKKALPYVTFTLTDRGKPIAQISATPEAKKAMMMKTAGGLKNTDLDRDDIWRAVAKKTSRKSDLTL